jgi:acyl carrier protein
MSRDEIVQALKELLPREMKERADQLDEDTRITDLGFDSMSILDLMYDVERRFGIEMKVADLIEMEHVRDLVDKLATSQTPS